MTDSHTVRRGRSVGSRPYHLRPLKPVPLSTRVILGVSFFVLFVAGWSLATYGGYVSPIFLASPTRMIEEGWLLLTRFGFMHDIGMTI